MHRLLALLFFSALSGAASAQAYRPDFDPSALKGPATSPPSEVMVLGSPHLAAIKNLDPALMQGLNDRLASWQPQAIAIEQLSGVQCDGMRRYAHQYEGTIALRCWDLAPARAATGLDVPEATLQWGQQLAHWPQTPTPAQRRHLAALFLAGGEKWSAQVQWLRLPAAERHAGDGLDPALVAFLQALDNRHDENALISVKLAVRLGHERLYAMDDHTADSSDPADTGDDAAVSAAVAKASDNPASAERMRTYGALTAQLRASADMVALYRALNAPGQGQLVFASDMGAAMNEPSPQHYGRAYLGYWETRNLRMAANIRTVLGSRPGTRMLVVVGASHKGYLEAYLNQMHDVRIVDTTPLLQ